MKTKIFPKFKLVGVLVIAIAAVYAYGSDYVVCWVTQAYGCNVGPLIQGAMPPTGNCGYTFFNCCTATGTYNDSRHAGKGESGLKGYKCVKDYCSGSCSGVNAYGNPFTISGSAPDPLVSCPASGDSCTGQ